MKCKKIKKMISSYIDDRLSKIEVEELNSHLDTCLSCREEYEIYKSIENDVVEEISPSDNFRVNFWGRIEEMNEKKKMIKGKLLLIPVYATVFLFLIITTLSATILYAYKSNIDDNAVDKEIVACYLNEGVLKAGFTPVSCMRFFEKGEGCVTKACMEACVEGRCKGGDECRFCKEEK